MARWIPRGTRRPIVGSGSTNATLYRVPATGLDDLASWNSSDDKNAEGGSSDRCELVFPNVSAKRPVRLELLCHSTAQDWHNPDLEKRGMNDQDRTDSLKWNGSRYTKP
jgi:hypothetical protein